MRFKYTESQQTKEKIKKKQEKSFVAISNTNKWIFTQCVYKTKISLCSWYASEVLTEVHFPQEKRYLHQSEDDTEMHGMVWMNCLFLPKNLPFILLPQIINHMHKWNNKRIFCLKCKIKITFKPRASSFFCLYSI